MASRRRARTSLRALGGLLLVLLTASCSAQQPVAAAAAGEPSGRAAAEPPGVAILPVRGNVFMLVGPEANATVQVGPQGVLVVDTMGAETTEPFLAAIRSLSDEPIRHVINTHVHPDHTGGNFEVSLAGDALFNKNYSVSDTAEDRAPIYAQENVLIAMSAMEEPPPFEAWPTSTYFTASKDLYFNGEAVRLFHAPNAHTNGDSIVYFRGSDVIAAGDVFITTGYPYIDVANGGSIDGIIDALNRIIEIAVPEALQENGTLIVPGHGRLCDESEVVEYRDMLAIIRDIIQERIDEGMTLAEVQAARPTFGFDVRYGADSGLWTTEQFVAAIYNELQGQETQ